MDFESRRVEEAPLRRRAVPRVFLPAGRDATVRRGRDGVTPVGPMVCAAHVLLCLVPGVLHRGGHWRLRQPSFRHEVPRRRGEQGSRLWRRFGLRDRSGGVLVHGAAPVCRHLQDGRGPGPGHRVSLRRSGDQRPGDHPDRTDSGPGTRHRPGGGSRRLQYRHRPADARDLSQGGSRARRPPDGHAHAGGEKAVVEQRPLFRLDGRYSRLRQLGPQRRHARHLPVLSGRADRLQDGRNPGQPDRRDRHHGRYRRQNAAASGGTASGRGEGPEEPPL